MNIPIKLSKNKFIRLQDVNYIATAGETITLEVESEYNLNNAVYVFQNGDKKVKTKCPFKNVKVPEEVLSVARLIK